MAKKKVLPSLEVIIIIVFFVSFVLWAMRKCSEDRALYVDEHEEVDESTVIDTTANVSDVTAESPTSESETTTPGARAANQAPPRKIKERYTPLYVTLENLNMRDAVGLQGKVLDRLKLYDEVTFLNEVTDSIYEINLGGLLTQAPWIKVRSRKGKIGWVYGAGVHYYKKKLNVIE